MQLSLSSVDTKNPDSIEAYARRAFHSGLGADGSHVRTRGRRRSQRTGLSGNRQASVDHAEARRGTGRRRRCHPLGGRGHWARW
jgi:hypothetical protein